MTSSRASTYHPDPQDFFSIDPQPEAFTVDMVEHYSFLPTGVMEITTDGIVAVHGNALSLYADEPRVFVVRHAGAAGLVELRGEALDLEAAEEYLTLFGRHITGAHIREYGRIGAAIIEACITFQRGMQHVADTPSIEENPVVSGKPARRCAFERGIRRIEVEQMPLVADRLISCEREMRDWKSWLAVKATAPSMIRQGGVPAGVSFLGDQVYELDPRRRHRLVPGQGRPTFTSRNQIVAVTAPNGTACLMCLDMLGAMKSAIDMDRSTVMAWLRSRVPADVLAKQDLQCTLYAQIAQRVVAHHRHGEALNLPNVVTEEGRSYPMLLDYRVIEAEFNAEDILTGPLS